MSKPIAWPSIVLTLLALAIVYAVGTTFVSIELERLVERTITPHIAGGTQHEGQYILEIFKENLAKFVKGEGPLRNQIDKERGF